VTLWRSDPERAADALIEASLTDLGLVDGARLLLINQGGTLPTTLAQHGFKTEVWNRRLSTRFQAATMPPAGPFDAALLRLPKSKNELEMTAHIACGMLAPYGRLLVYGGNDEGVRTAANRLASLTETSQTLATRAHGRIFAIARADVGHIKSNLPEWRTARPDGWVSYPGLFAGGDLDPGTALLLKHLPPIAAGARVLDYGCGPGAISAAVRTRAPEATIDGVDNDAIALIAAVENVPKINAVLGADLTGLSQRTYDLILSNPPLHTGIREDHTALDAFLAQAPARLAHGGQVMAVVQRRIPLDQLMQKQFKHVSVAAETTAYRLWRAAN
jgi:16S rRNA (guanine1207-N2)-methyltransferase